MGQERGPSRAIATDPYLSFRFRVEINNSEVGGFSEVTGLTLENDVQTFREGGVNTHEIQLLGPTKFPSRIVMKRGIADSGELWKWYQEVLQGCITRKQVTIVLRDLADDEKWRWAFDAACPVKWTGPDFRAGASEVAFESIELVHKGLNLGAQNGPKC